MRTLLPAREDFARGLRMGLPIALGYIPVSFAFGLFAVGGGLPPLAAILFSLSNVTSAGQFAGARLLAAGAGHLEIVLTVFIINIRYSLMSLSLSQRIAPETTLWQRLVFGFGITDETFAVASVQGGSLTYSYLLGLICLPVLGWGLGTALGALISSALPETLCSALGIALYAMFIAIIMPQARKSLPVLAIILISVGVNLAFTYLPLFGFLTAGFRIILATVLGAGAGALLWPMREETEGG